MCGAIIEAATKAAPAASAASTPPSAPARTSPYRLLGILDPDRELMVAFALKMPGDWRAKQEFHRKWEGAVGLPQIYLLSPRTAVTFVEDDERAASIIRKGTAIFSNTNQSKIFLS